MTKEHCAAKRPLRLLAAVLFGLSCAPWLPLAGTLQFMPAAHAAERGNFNRLAPRYHRATNTVTFEGKTFVSDAKGTLDKDHNGIKETKLERYNAGPHEKILRYETKGIIWAWAVYKDYDHKSSRSNYVVVNWAGEGVFDTKLTTDEGFGLPGYLKGPARSH